MEEGTNTPTKTVRAVTAVVSGRRQIGAGSAAAAAVPSAAAAAEQQRSGKSSCRAGERLHSNKRRGSATNRIIEMLLFAGMFDVAVGKSKKGHIFI